MRTGSWVERIPHGGEPHGTAALFRGWAAHLPSTVELCPVLLPGYGVPAPVGVFVSGMVAPDRVRGTGTLSTSSGTSSPTWPRRWRVTL